MQLSQYGDHSRVFAPAQRRIQSAMIGRKQRKRVIYVDGIPIESTLLDAGESGLKGTDKSDPASLAALDPRQLFDKYDTDGSGDIDFQEFKVLLRDLGVSLPEPKARAYFKRCDRRRRGSISFEEFRLALYTCDPKNPGRTGGFAPGQSLAPKDLFEMFDHDEEDAIDRGTFMELLEFLGRKMPLDKMEALFATYEDPELEMLTYFQFKKAWLSIVDVQAELRQRGERFNKFLPPAMLAKKLAMLVSLEEKQEARMLLEASYTLSDEMVAAQRRELVREARLLARVTLTEALDAAGQVYVFGKGAFQRFDGEPREPDFVEFMEFGLVRELWRQRIRPPVPSASSTVSVVVTTTPSGDKKKDSSGSEQNDLQLTDQSAASPGLVTSGNRPSPSRTILETAARAFADRQISKATAFLWGKRVSHVACGAAMAYALTDAGEVFCWGGNKRQWRYFYDEATCEDGKKPHNGHNPEEGAAIRSGDRQQLLDRPLTTRSEMLKLFALPSQVVESQETHAQLELRQKYAKVFEKPEPLILTEEDKRRRLQLVGQYYDLLNPVAPSTTDKPIASPPLQELLETVEPELHVDDLSLSLYIRGVELAKPTRMALLEALGECLELELECVSARFHAHMKQQDQVARRYRKERRERPLAVLTLKTTARWFELRELREKMANAEHERLTKGEDEYGKMKRTIMRSTQKLKRRTREGRNAIVSGSSNNHSHVDMESEKALLYVNGLTSRSPALRFFDGSQALQTIAVGSRHALAIRASGQLFSWGVGSFGRLGGTQIATTSHAKSVRDGSNSKEEEISVDSWHHDAYTAQIVPALRHLRFRAVACGFGHSLALSTDGTVYAWGSATHGKLGIGPVQAQECFTLVPLALRSLVTAGVRVRKIACGPSHSALLSVDGALFVWGSGDGGKLGLGDGRDVGEDRVPRGGGQLRVIPSPTRVVDPFGREKLAEVSCGASHTAVLTAIECSSDGRANGGGRVYVAGSNHALGKFTPQFTAIEVEDASATVMLNKVSCGSSHTALVSSEGELYTWGKNVGGSTGHCLGVAVVERPTRVSCLYERPRNLCLDQAATACQSSQNGSCLAEYALGGGHAANELRRRRQTRRASGGDQQPPSTAADYSQTQQELCPFWQVALSERCRIVSVRVVVVAGSFSSALENEATARSSLTTKRRPGSAAAEDAVKIAIMVAEDAFDPELRGKQALAKARALSVHGLLSFSGRREMSWTVPTDTFGRSIRVQLESSSGVAMLGLQRVEVLGVSSEAYVGPRVVDVVCSEALTVAICPPLNIRGELREKFQRAVRADRASVDVLAQLETFHPFVREEEQQIRQEAALYTVSATARSSSEKREVAAAIAELEAKKRATSCVLCRPKTRCVICEVEQQLGAGKLKLAELSGSQQPAELPGSQPTLIKKTVAAIEPLQPQAELPRTLEALCSEFLALDTRSREEEEEEHKQLELKLMSESALVRAKREEEAAARGQVVAGSKLLAGTVSMRDLATRLLIYARGSFNRK